MVYLAIDFSTKKSLIRRSAPIVAILLLVAVEMQLLPEWNTLVRGTVGAITGAAIAILLPSLTQWNTRSLTDPTVSSDNFSSVPPLETPSPRSTNGSEIEMSNQKVQPSTTEGNKPTSDNKGSTFFKVGPNALVTGLSMTDVQTDGFDTNFDVEGHLIDPKIERFNGSKSNRQGSSVYIGQMKIESVGRMPPPKVGRIQPGWPEASFKNEDGTFTHLIPFIIESGAEFDLVVAIRGEGLHRFEIFQSKLIILTKEVNPMSFMIARQIPKASGEYSIRITGTNPDPNYQIAFSEQ